MIPESAATQSGLAAAFGRMMGGAPGLLSSALRDLAAGRLPEATASLGEVRSLHPDAPEADEAAFWLAEAARRRGRPEEAVSFLRLVRQARSGEAAWRLVWLLSARERADEAASLAERVSRGNRAELATDALCWLGLRLLGQRRFGEASERLERALGRESATGPGARRRAPFLLALALARRGQGDAGGAQQALVHLLLDLPDHPVTAPARLTLGFVLLSSGNTREAGRNFSWCLDAKPVPDLAERARFGLGLASLEGGEEDRACAVFQELAPEGSLRRWARLAQAWAAVRHDEWDQALGSLDGAPPKGAEAFADFLRGSALTGLGRPEEALAAFEAVAEASPLRPAALQGAAEAALARDAPTRAAGLLETLTAGFPAYSRRDSAWVALARAKQALGQIDPARRALEAVSPTSVAYPEALYRRGLLELQAERWDDASALLGRLVERFPADRNREKALLALARADYQRRSVGQALRALDALEGGDSSPGSRDAARFTKAWMLARTGQEGEAEPLLRSLLAEAPRGPFAARSFHTLAWMALQREDCAAALPLLESALALNPGGDLEREARTKRADCLFALGRYPEALEGYRSLSGDPAARFGEGLTLAKLGRLDEVEAAAAPLASSADDADRRRAADLFAALGRGRAEAGDATRSAAAWERAAALRRGGEAAAARLEAGRSWLRAGDVARGLEALGAAAEAPEPAGAEALEALAQALEKAGRHPEAAGAWDRLGARTQGLARALALRAAARLRAGAGDLDGGAARLRQALAAVPQREPVSRQALLTDLGELLLRAARPDEALAPLSESATAGLGAEGLRALGLLARAQREAGRTDEALASYVRIGYLYPPTDPDAARAVFAAAEALEELKRPDRARLLYQILAREASDAWAARARGRLEAIPPGPPP